MARELKVDIVERAGDVFGADILQGGLERGEDYICYLLVIQTLEGMAMHCNLPRVPGTRET